MDIQVKLKKAAYLKNTNKLHGMYASGYHLSYLELLTNLIGYFPFIRSFLNF